MKATFKYYCFLAFFLVSTLSFAQKETEEWKALIAVGLNNPSQSGLIDPFEANSTNFPSINLGLQYMFKRQFGVKLDFGYNRFSNADNTPDFKINYTRINAQFVYDAKTVFNFLPKNMGVVFHAGPGFSMVKPLDIYRENKNSYLNGLAGLELHYGISRTLSAYIDGSYIYGFSGDFDPVSEGAGSFNGNMLTVTVGVAVSLSACRTCN